MTVGPLPLHIRLFDQHISIAKNTAIHACIMTAFWGTERLGEVTVPKLDGFDPTKHIKVSDVQNRV